MRVEQLTKVESICIHDAQALDPITVFLNDRGNNQGSITIVCYGQSWSAYFGSMGSPLKDFLCRISPEYLAGKMELPKYKKHEKDYLFRIVDAVLSVVREGF